MECNKSDCIDVRQAADRLAEAMGQQARRAIVLVFEYDTYVDRKLRLANDLIKVLEDERGRLERTIANANA